MTRQMNKSDNSLGTILADLKDRLERIEAKLNILIEREVPTDQLHDYGWFTANPDAQTKRHKQPWE